ncbi:MAG: hypothetical protein HCAMLNBO_02176 [Candidatus Brocadia fulgida]|nr:hypothetical protein [Candidatus Brocadia fulgida]
MSILSMAMLLSGLLFNYKRMKPPVHTAAIPDSEFIETQVRRENRIDYLA